MMCILSIPEIRAQVKIGSRPELLDSSAVLELESSDKGLRLPRVKLDDLHVWALAGAQPASGMIVYNEEGLLPKGIYCWNTDLEQWVRVVSFAEMSTLIDIIQGGAQNTMVVQIASNGQRRFATPVTITDPKKVQVYRNGINVEFDQVDDKHIDLEIQATCYTDDEVKIIQLK
ncbi:MAG: hypothetical protein JZU53_01545 [Paludibacter sp.]|nr:hypothetical protein [Paludibacter sp.]